MAGQVKPVPSGYHTVTPYLTLSDAASAIDFYKKAFGATERYRMDRPDGKIGHAEIQIGDSIVMVADESSRSDSRSPKSLGGTTAGIFLYVENVDAVFDTAVKAGAKVHHQHRPGQSGDADASRCRGGPSDTRRASARDPAGR